MSFLLLGTHPDGHLSLLSATAFATRQDAMAELSRLTADPAFDAWDAEVLVIDSDAGTPVLLVRPSLSESGPATEEAAPSGETTEVSTEGAESPSEAPEVAEEADAALTAVMLDLGVGEDEEQEAAEATDVEPEQESPEAPEPSEPESAEEPEPPAPVVDEEAEPTTRVADEEPDSGSEVQPSAEDAFVAESEPPAEVVDAAWASAVESTSGDSEGLKGALKRTAAQMEAEGISAPESVGAAEDTTSDVAEPEPTTAGDEPEQPEIGLPESVSAERDADAGETESDADEPAAPAAIDEPEQVVAEPEETDDLEGELVPETSPDQSAEASADEPPPGSAAWPWDLAADPDSAPPLAALDEPSPDDESMIRALADDDASRTVVLGEYSVEEVKESEPFVEAAKRVAAEEAAAAPVAEAASQADDAVVAETPSVVSEQADVDTAESAPDSDFVDLGEVSPAPAKAYEPGEVDMDGMTCDDCVYVDTCPNKDEREPANCGSFQWK